MNILIVLLIVLLLCGGIGAYPAWPHAQSWGYFPSGIIGVVLLVVLILALSGRV